MAGHLALASVLTTAFIGANPLPQPSSPVPRSAEQLVQALGQFPAEFPATSMVPPPLEQLRLEVYDRLWSLGFSAVPELCRGLTHSDVQVHRNVALFLGVAGGNWYDLSRPRLAVAQCAPSLVKALDDHDGRVRELAAQAIPGTGTAGVSAVPTLIGMLSSSSEGDRNTACIALAGLGPAAKEAVPALNALLSDPSANVRGFAWRALERIER